MCMAIQLVLNKRICVKTTCRGLVQSQMDAGCTEDASRSCASALQLARKKVQSKLIDLLKLEVLRCL